MKVVGALGRAVAISLCVLASACGGGNSAAEPTAAAGASAASGSAGAQGQAGSSGVPQGGRNATGGTSGGPSVGNVFEPGVALPSFDCRTDAVDKNCVSMAGTFDGHAIDLHCASLQSIPGLSGSPEAWLFGCMTSEGHQLRLALRTRSPGTFSETLVPDSAPVGLDVSIATTETTGSRGADATDAHFIGGRMAGSVTRVANGHELAVGTFHASWGAPGIPCHSLGADECAPADLNGTFMGEQTLGVCTTDADCAPLKCYSAGHQCNP